MKKLFNNDHFLSFQKFNYNLKRIRFYSVCLLLCFQACINQYSKKENEVLVDKFPLDKNLIGEELKIPSIILKPSNICIIDSFLIVAQSRQDSLFSIFRLPDCDYLLSFGKRGRGPDEFNLSFEHVTLGPVYKKKSSFAVGNRMTKVQYYAIDDIIKKNYAPYKTVGLPPKLSHFRAIVYIGDSLIFGAPYESIMHLFKYNNFTKVLESFIEYPEKFPLMDPQTKREVFGCFMTVKPDNSKFALAYGNQGKLEIYDINNTLPITVLYKGFPTLYENTGLKRSSKYMKLSENEIYFSGFINSTNKYIYLCIYNEKCSIVFGKDGPNRAFIPEIHVFDWSGNPIAKIKLFEFFLYFDVDIMDNFLYTIDDNIENIIRRYDLSKILN